jgi:hypothetical protein
VDDWVDLVHWSQGVRAVFGPRSPSLNGIELREARFVGHSLRLDFDLADYPEEPPPKWRAKSADTVRLMLDASPMQDLLVTRWGTCGRADLTLTRHDGLIDLMLEGRGVRLSMTTETVCLLSMSAHTDEDSPPPG